MPGTGSGLAILLFMDDITIQNYNVPLKLDMLISNKIYKILARIVVCFLAVQ